MPVNFNDTLVIGVSSRSLFDLELEEQIFKDEGESAYKNHQLKHEETPLKPGTGFYLVQSLLALNQLTEKRLVEVIIMSRNSPETGLRVLNSIQHHQLDITRSTFTGGQPIAPYLSSFKVDLFLSKNEIDVQQVIDSNIAAAGLLCTSPSHYEPIKNQVRIAFDADAVLFAEDSELIYKQQGIDAFHANESAKEDEPLKEGPHGKLLKLLSTVQRTIKAQNITESPLRIAIVTARNSPSHKRVIKTLRNWDVEVDEAHFLGGMDKTEILRAFNAQIFFDDQDTYLDGSQQYIPSAKVPYKSDSALRQIKKK